jgi:iron complex transport system permease protein
LPAITYWLLGSFQVSRGRLGVAATALFAISLVYFFLLRWRINLLALPTMEARALGLDVKRTRLIVIVAATLMTAVSVALCSIVELGRWV